MIHINLENKSPDSEWITSAQSITEKLNAAQSREERSNLIGQYAKHWGKLKEWLLNQSHNKCWYTESFNDDSYMEVDHFRPKANAKNLDDTEREGYWWLAFEWKNYRACGQVANNKKSNHFALKIPARSASSTDRNTADELHYFLDPIKREDPPLLSFNSQGDAIPAIGLTDWDKERVEYSIIHYHLNYSRLCTTRSEVWNKCNMLLNELFNAEEEHLNNPSAQNNGKINSLCKQISEMLAPKEAFTRVVVACITTRLMSAGSKNYARLMDCMITRV